MPRRGKQERALVAMREEWRPLIRQHHKVGKRARRERML